jgi:hypothetical protein
MARLLIQFWPVFLPFIIYLLWYLRDRKRRLANGEEVLSFLAGPIWITMLSSVVIGIGMFIWLGLSAPAEKGEYQRTTLQDGKLIKGSIGQ